MQRGEISAEKYKTYSKVFKSVLNHAKKKKRNTSYKKLTLSSKSCLGIGGKIYR